MSKCYDTLIYDCYYSMKKQLFMLCLIQFQTNKVNPVNDRNAVRITVGSKTHTY